MAETWETPQMVQERGFRWSRVVVYGLLVFFGAIYLLPLLVMLLTSFKPLPEIYAGNMVALPRHWTVEPWVNAWTKACVGLNCNASKGTSGTPSRWPCQRSCVPPALGSSIAT